jgi:membrane protein YqaA with SNARE-associated domain
MLQLASACILACNAAYFVLLASTFALASSLPFKSESAVSA